MTHPADRQQGGRWLWVFRGGIKDGHVHVRRQPPTAIQYSVPTLRLDEETNETVFGNDYYTYHVEFETELPVVIFTYDRSEDF